MHVLISGAGIAGPTLAYWLDRYGVKTTIVEKAPAPRTGGYVIDFWGAGFDIADLMGLLPEIRRHGYVVQEVRVVDASGARIAGFPVKAFARATKNRFISLPRSDLAAVIFGAVQQRIEVIFDDVVTGIEQTADRARVTFESGAVRDFDVVVGADGLHSQVRELVWGPENRFERYLGYKVAAFQVEGYRPRDELVYVMYTEVGQQVARFAMHGDRTMFLFIFADPQIDGDAEIEQRKATLRRRFGRSGWECRRILDALDGVDHLYFDRVSQIWMGGRPGGWARGRVALVGDAASCVSFLAGQGAALAMTAAYILAGEIHRAGAQYDTAFARYEERFAPFVRKKQNAALRFAGAFAPRSRLSMFVRNQVMSLLTIPWVADAVVGRELTDNLTLPDY